MFSLTCTDYSLTTPAYFSLPKYSISTNTTTPISKSEKTCIFRNRTLATFGGMKQKKHINYAILEFGDSGHSSISHTISRNLSILIITSQGRDVL